MNDLKWFLARIGKTIERDFTVPIVGNPKRHLYFGKSKTIFILNEVHAKYLYMVSCDLGIKYHDKKDDII